MEFGVGLRIEDYEKEQGPGEVLLAPVLFFGEHAKHAEA